MTKIDIYFKLCKYKNHISAPKVFLFYQVGLSLNFPLKGNSRASV